MPELYIVTEQIVRGGESLYSVRHAATGYKVTHGFDRAAMEIRAAELNANPPQVKQATGPSCHFCGLDARSCDCR